MSSLHGVFGNGIVGNGIVGKIAAILLLGAAMGCSVDGQITDTTKRTTKSTSSQLTGIAAGSEQYVTTPNNYKVSSSLGSPYGGNLITTTANGYKVYSALQGNINAETTETTSE